MDTKRVISMKNWTLLFSISLSLGAVADILNHDVVHTTSQGMSAVETFNADALLKLDCPVEKNGKEVISVFKMCSGDLDPAGTYSNGSGNTPSDYILSKAYEARNIKGSSMDAQCRYLSEKNLWSEIGNNQKASIQDLIDFKCKQNSFACDDNIEVIVRAKYQESLDKINPRYHRYIPETDRFFDEELNNVKFEDANGSIVKIPKPLLIAILHEESKGDIKDMDGYDYGIGLFNIRRATRLVKTEEDVVVGIHAAGNEYDTNPKYPDVLSLYNPKNNLLKFTQMFQSKYNYFQQTLNGANGSLDFDEFSEEEKIKFIMTSYQSSEGHLIKAYQRLQKFNKAMVCNSCQAFKKQNGSCKKLKVSCTSPSADNCGQVLPENFEVIQRFSNFSGVQADSNFQNNMSCLVSQHFGQDDMGPCNLGLTFSYTRRIMAGHKCIN